jgi:hypothetical protein
MPMADSLNGSLGCCQIEGACGTNGGSPDVRSLFLPRWHHSSNDIPVWKPFTRLACLGPVRGKPNLSMQHICRDPCPLAVMRRGTTPWMCMCSGVDAPTMPDRLLTATRRTWDWPSIPRYLCIRSKRSLTCARLRLVSVGPA